MNKVLRQNLIMMGIIVTSIMIMNVLLFYIIENVTLNKLIQTAKLSVSYIAGKAEEWTNLNNDDNDYKQDDIINYILSLNIPFDGYIFLTDKEGFIIAHPYAEYMPLENRFPSVNVVDIYYAFDLLNPDDNHFEAMDYDNIPRLFIPYTIDSNDWIVCLVISMDKVSMFHNKLINWLIPLIDIASVLICVFIFHGLRIIKLNKSKEILKQTQKLYLKAIANMNIILFDYNVSDKQAVYSRKFHEKHGISEVMLNTPQSLIEMDIIHKDDVSAVYAMFSDIDGGADTSECIVRINDLEENEIWYSIIMTNSFDRNGSPSRAVAVVRDITDEKNAELLLQSKVELDLMTGAYNKVSGISLVEKELNNTNEKAIHALFVMDIDNFKSINDNLGHDVGDIVILEVSQILMNIFQKTDIVCRFGGDEFMVFAKDIPNTDFITKKAEEICDAMRKSYGEGDKVVNISASIGVAYFPFQGLTYEELFKKADDALYETKANGKNSYTIFSDK